MLYTILCYNSEQLVGSWTKEQDDAVMSKLIAVQDRMAKNGKLGPVARLHPTKSAKTLWKDRSPHLITDGPYAETKEAILGFYVVDCATEEEAMEFVKELGEVNPGGGVRATSHLVLRAGHRHAVSEHERLDGLVGVESRGCRTHAIAQ